MVAGVNVIVIKRFEGRFRPLASTLNAIERTLIDAVLIDEGVASPAGAGAGVRLARHVKLP
jgi:hypothetical protein